MGSYDETLCNDDNAFVIKQFLKPYKIIQESRYNHHEQCIFIQLPSNVSVNINQLSALHEVEIVIYDKITEYICKIVCVCVYVCMHNECNIIINKSLGKNIKSFTSTCF